MKRILWGRDSSINVMKVTWLLEELSLPYSRKDVGGSFGGTDTPEYRLMNPNGTVPTLQEDLLCVWESNAIMRFVCTAHAPDSRFWPNAAQSRARVDQWLDAQQTLLTRPQGVIFMGLVRTPPEKRDPAAIAQGVKDASKIWSLLSKPLSEHPYIAGDTLTLADIAWGVHVHRWFNLPFDRHEIAGLRSWYDRLCERPAYAAHVAGPIT